MQNQTLFCYGKAIAITFQGTGASFRTSVKSTGIKRIGLGDGVDHTSLETQTPFAYMGKLRGLKQVLPTRGREPTLEERIQKPRHTAIK